MTKMDIFSFGGGVQSVACMVLAKQGKIEVKEFVFANVGEDSENPATLKYISETVRPYMEKHGLKFAEVRRKGDTLLQRLMSDRKSVDIPIYLQSGAPGNRNCTFFYKIKPIAKYAVEHYPLPVRVGLGISLDEISRAKDSKIETVKNVFPLLDLYFRRDDCLRIIQEEGLPIPEKSSCFFCPYKRLEDWKHLKQNQPDLYKQASKLEKFLNVKRERMGKDRVYLSSLLKPLEDMDFSLRQGDLFEECEGHCWT